MGLMKLINTENDKNYISLKEAVELLAKESSSNIWEVATYLLNKDVHIRLYSFSRSIDHKIVQNSFLAYEGGQTSWIGDNDAFGWLQYIAQNEVKSCASRIISNFSKYYNGCIETFWDREAFFNDEYIKEALNLSDPFFESISLEVEQASYREYVSNSWISSEEPNYDFWNVIEQYLNDEDKKNYIPQRCIEYDLDKNYQKLCDQLKEDNEKLKDELGAIKEEKLNPNDTNNDNLSFGMATIGHASSEHYQNRCKELLEEVEKLKAEILEKNERIKQLESTKLSIDSDLLSMIFDESSTHRYAPDLVYAIRAWESIYVKNPKIDSHNNKANTWISKNTPYSGEQENGATRRLREIISPYIEWKDTRKKLLDRN